MIDTDTMAKIQVAVTMGYGKSYLGRDLTAEEDALWAEVETATAEIKAKGGTPMVVRD